MVEWPSQNRPNFTHFVSTNELWKVVIFFCQKATGSWEFGPEITIFVWSRYLKYNLLEMLLPAHGYFNVPGHFLGLDYMTKNQRLAFGAARNHGSKVWKLNFQANFECLCHNTSPLILLFKWKSSIYSIKNYKNTHRVLLAFFVIRQQTSNI